MTIAIERAAKTILWPGSTRAAANGNPFMARQIQIILQDKGLAIKIGCSRGGVH